MAPHKAAQYGFDLLQANEKGKRPHDGKSCAEQGGRMHWCWKSIWNGNAFVAEARMKNLQELPKLRDSITYLYLSMLLLSRMMLLLLPFQKMDFLFRLQP